MTRGPGVNAAGQRERLLAELRRRQGTASPWVSGQDFRENPACDGGPPIFNVTPRVSELRRDHLVVTDRAPDGTAIYRLARGLGDVPTKQLVEEARAAARDEPGEQLLLELPAARPGLYDVDDAAA